MWRRTRSIGMPLLFVLGVGCSSGGAHSNPGEDLDVSAKAGFSGSAEAGGSGGSSGDAGANASGGAGGAAGSTTTSGGAGPRDGDGGTDASSIPTAPRIAAFDEGTCALSASGAMVCWGATPPHPSTIPSPPGAYKALSAQFLSACGLSVTGAVECYGLPGAENPPTPPTGTFVDLAVGRDAVCVVDSAGIAQCTVDEIGAAPAGERLFEVSAGTDFACGIRLADRSVVCWGSPGHDYTACVRAPAEGQLAAPLGAFVQISTGLAHSCGIRMDGSVACWGAGKPGAAPTMTACTPPQRFNYGQSAPPSGTFKTIAAGQYTTCGVKTDGTVACWGAGATAVGCQDDIDGCGQALPPSGTFEEVAVGYTHACAMRSNHTVVCWGSNTGGRSTPPQEFQ